MARLTERIPHEVIVSILQACSYTEVIFFAQTCKTYHDLVARSSRLQLQIELQSSGFQLSDVALRNRGESTARTLLEEFRRFRDGWLYMQLGEPLRLDPVDPDMRLYELRQGYYAAALSSTYSLPSVVKFTNLHGQPAEFVPLGTQFSEFQIDPSQDLMALVSLSEPISMISTIYLRSMRTGAPHKDAQHPQWSLTLPFYMERRSSGIFIEIMDDLVAVKYVSYEKDVSNVLVCNWKTGRLLNRIQIEGLSCTFGFLTADSILVFQSMVEPALHLLIYSNIRTPGFPMSGHWPECVVSAWPSMSPSYDFGFPEFPESSFSHLLMRSEPAPTLYSTGPAKFLPRPEARVIQLCMTVIQNAGRERGLNQYQIFLSKERLMEAIDSARRSELDDAETVPSMPGLFKLSSADTIDVPWEDWGERTTRWFSTASAISPWICRAYGTRFIQSHPCIGDPEAASGPDPVRPREFLSVLEFHRPTIRRLASSGCDDHLSMWSSKDSRRHHDCSCTDEEAEYMHNTLRNGIDSGKEVFVDTIDEDVPSRTPFNGRTVVTRLPYRIVTRRRPVEKHSGWMMDNNLIVGMPGDDMENIQNEHMNVYTPLA